MKKNKFGLPAASSRIIIIILFSLYLANGCKEPDSIGLDQISNLKLGVVYTDTCTIEAYSLIDDSVKTYSTELNLAGTMHDPVFGKTNAGFYTQIHLSTTNVNFGSNPVVDSLVLSLAYNGFYGDISTSQTFRIYELSEALYDTAKYYSFNKAGCLSEPIATKTFYPKPNDSIKVKVNGKDTKLAPHLRIKLNPEFAEKIIHADASNLANNTKFIEFFKGIFVSADSNTAGVGAIINFNLLSSLSGLTMYYRNSDDTNKLSYSFIFESACARFNSYNHFGYNTAIPALKSQIKDSLPGIEALYLQAMSGIKVKLRFPFLKNLIAGEKIAINKAELIIRANSTEATNLDTGVYAAPPKLSLLRITKDRKLLIPPDYNIGATYYGGYYDKIKKEYRFSLSIYMQDILNDLITGDKGMYLIVEGASDNARRIVLNGTKPAAGPENKRNLKLQITYTRLGEKNN